MGSVRILKESTGEVFDSIRSAAKASEYSAYMFSNLLKRGELEGFSKYVEPESKAMVFAEHPRGRIVLTTKYYGVKKIFPFGDVNALNDVLSNMSMHIPSSQKVMTSYLYLKSKINK